MNLGRIGPRLWRLFPAAIFVKQNIQQFVLVLTISHGQLRLECPLAQHIHDLVSEYADQPGAQGRLCRELAAVLDGCDRGFLHGIFGQMTCVGRTG